MFISGILAFLQTVFIPGFIALKYAGINRNADPGNEKGSSKIRQLVYGFGLSLLTNYLLVFLLTITGIYKPLTLYIILVIEGVLLVYYYWKRQPPPSGYMRPDPRRWLTSWKQFTASNSLTYNLLLLISFAIILWYVFLFFYFLGGVFGHWDPVVGWNRFALDWASNRLPSHTWHYPQLIPTNWSISYVLLQNTDVQCFARAIMPLFSLGVLLLFLDLALEKKKSLYLSGLIFYGIILGYIYDPSYIVSGYVDIAVSFFAFLAFYALHRLHEEKKNRDFNAVRWAVVFASAAAVTKQAGLFFLAVILVWSFIKIITNRKALSPKKTAGIILFVLLTVSVITVSWYVLKEIQIHGGKDRSEVEMVQHAHRYDNYPERFNRAVTRLATHRHPKLQYLFYAGILIMLLGVFHKKSRWITLFIVIPYSLIWGFFFSYDNRNLAPAIPFMAFAAAGGMVFLKRLLPGGKKLPVFKIPVIPVIILILLVIAGLNFTLFNNDAIIRQQIHKKMKMGDAELNELLYRFHKKQGITGKIATNYLYLQYLPGLEQFYRYHPGRVSSEFLEYLETPGGKEIHYLLVPMILKSEEDVYQRFQEKIKTGQYRQLFKCRGYRFIEVRRH